MPAGGLLQLVAIGAQDYLFTSNISHDEMFTRLAKSNIENKINIYLEGRNYINFDLTMSDKLSDKLVEKNISYMLSIELLNSNLSELNDDKVFIYENVNHS